MEQLKVFLGTVDIMENADAVLDSVDDLVKDLESSGSVIEETGHSGTGDASVEMFPNTECNDGERAILAGYVSLVRQCIELAEKVGAAKALADQTV